MSDRKAKNLVYSTFLKGPGEMSSGKLEIASFQRNYVWKSSEIKKIITSICNNEPGYYIGNFVIQRSEKGVGGYDKIVDGQQRAVTISLLANALRSILPNNKDVEKCEHLIFYSNNSTRIKFSRSNLDKAYKSIINGTDLVKLDESQELFFKNYKYIKKQLDRVSDKSDFLKKLLALEVVVIKCETTASVYQLFEALNSHGKKLSAIELIKNGLFAELELSSVKEGKLTMRWEQIERNFESENAKNLWFGKFMRHNWFSVGGHVRENELFESIKNYIRSKDVIKFTDSLVFYSKLYVDLRNGDLSKKDLSDKMHHPSWQKVEQILRLIGGLGLDQVYAVLLALIKYGKNNPTYFKREEFFEDVNKVWSYLILVKYSNISPASYETPFANFCRDLLLDTATDKRRLKQAFFKKLKANIPTKTDFSIRLNESIFCTSQEEAKVDHRNNREYIRLLLLLYLSDGNKLLGDYRIEHIVPKGNLSKWRNVTSESLPELSEVHRYRLGNLTLLKIDIGGNENFNKKYTLGFSKSEFNKNVNLAKYEKLFNSGKPQDAINKRGKEIGEAIYNVLKNSL